MKPIKLFCDNNSTISISHNPVQHDRTKHIEIERHFIKEKLNSGLIVTTHVPTGLQVADVFTKGLPITRLQELNDKMVVRPLDDWYTAFQTLSEMNRVFAVKAATRLAMNRSLESTFLLEKETWKLDSSPIFLRKTLENLWLDMASLGN
ncbi:Copia protein, partial [Mucuna pruriens]